MDIRHGHAAQTCGMNMWQDNCLDMRQGNAAWTFGMNMLLGHAAWTSSMGKQHGHTAGTCSRNMRHRYEAWTCRMSALHACDHNHVAFTCCMSMLYVHAVQKHYKHVPLMITCKVIQSAYLLILCQSTNLADQQKWNLGLPLMQIR